MARKKAPPAPDPPPQPEPEVVDIVEVVEWQGIKIDAHYQSRYCGAPHLELHVLDPPLAPIPVSETGYRSRFDPSLPEYIERLGVSAFVKAWLDEEAKSPAWKKMQAPKQLDLFG
jgi:hypothetical protein